MHKITLIQSDITIEYFSRALLFSHIPKKKKVYPLIRRRMNYFSLGSAVVSKRAQQFIIFGVCVCVFSQYRLVKSISLHYNHGLKSANAIHALAWLVHNILDIFFVVFFLFVSYFGGKLSFMFQCKFYYFSLYCRWWSISKKKKLKLIN